MLSAAVVGQGAPCLWSPDCPFNSGDGAAHGDTDGAVRMRARPWQHSGAAEKTRHRVCAPWGRGEVSRSHELRFCTGRRNSNPVALGRRSFRRPLRLDIRRFASCAARQVASDREGAPTPQIIPLVGNVPRGPALRPGGTSGSRSGSRGSFFFFYSGCSFPLHRCSYNGAAALCL